MSRLEGGPVGEKYRPLKDVVELTDVARPRIGHEGVARFQGESLQGQRIVCTDTAEKILGQKQDVLRPFPEWRKAYRDDGETMVKILPKLTGADGGLQIHVGGTDEPRVGRLVTGPPESPDTVLLDDGEELRLKWRREQRNLVEEDRAPMRRLEEAGLGPTGVGEGPSLIAEQLGLEKRLWYSGAVHVYERTLASRTEAVDEAGEKPFTGTSFPLEKDGGGPAPGGLVSDEAADCIADGLDSGTPTDEFVQRVHDCT
jgi:hypothetical protein